MNKLIIALVGASIMAIGGCASTEQMAVAPTAPALSAEAQTALTQAQADVASAKKQNALWTSAESDLKAAEAAAKTADSATVIQKSKKASDEAMLGIAQLKLPSTDQFK
ncbi:MAG: hypothetical protein P4L77_13880 [Sulfuriferula sp.]|nr:hypothetical protein [Sulfuriferula sp.]